MKNAECAKTARIAALVCFLFHGIIATIYQYYFIVFFAGMMFDYIFAVLPAIVFRYKIIKKPLNLLESTGATMLVMGIYLVACMTLWAIQRNVFANGSLPAPYVWWGYFLLDDWIMCRSERKNESKSQEEWEPLWAKVLHLLPFGVKWQKIEQTDFGAMLKKQYYDYKSRNIDGDKLAYYIMLSSELAVLEERTGRRISAVTPNSGPLCVHAEKVCKKMFRKRFINDEERDSLMARIKHCREILCVVE